MGICDRGGVCCDDTVSEDGIQHQSIAHQHIKDRRARRQVPVSSGGTLAHYVPFYFAPRSPMLFAISTGNIIGYEEGQCAVVYLVSSVERILEVNRPFCFTDGHADMAVSNYYNDVSQLDHIDWPLMESQYWNDTMYDSDRKRRRQAEFLVHRFFPLTLVDEIGVFDANFQTVVRETMAKVPCEFAVNVHRKWYY